jgi:hypothetical protein
MSTALSPNGMTAMDIAFWGIAGKARNAPVRIPGGGVTDMECFASLVRYADPSLGRAGVRRAIEARFRTLKLHEMKPSAMRAAREEACPDIEPTVDVNCPWTLTGARARGEELNAAALTRLDEPLWPALWPPLWPPGNFDVLAELSGTTAIPDVVQPSPARTGVHNIPVMPHDFYDGPGLLAAIHATAALAATDLIEWRRFELEAPIHDGALTSERAGLGCLKDRILELTPIQMSAGFTKGNEPWPNPMPPLQFR